MKFFGQNNSSQFVRIFLLVNFAILLLCHVHAIIFDVFLK